MSTVRIVVIGFLTLGLTTSCSSDSDQSATQSSASTTTATTTTATLAASQPTITAPPIVGSGALAADTFVYDATTVANELGEVEEAIISPTTDPKDLTALGARQQALYRAYGRLDLNGQSDVLVDVPDDVRKTVLQMTSAGAALRNLGGSNLSGVFPSWTVRQPLPAEQLKSYYVEAGAKYDVPWMTLAAINFVETRFGRIVGPSNAGAIGPMQFLASSWNLYGEGGDITDDRDSIFAAANFLAQHDAKTDLNRAIYAYNPSDEYVTAIVNYSAVLQANPTQLDSMHGWQVYVRLATGDYLLPAGWTKP